LICSGSGLAGFFARDRFVGFAFDDGDAVLFDSLSHATHALEPEAAVVFTAALRSGEDREAAMVDALRSLHGDREEGWLRERLAATLAALREADLLDSR
jgi:PqqD family protein of HPr-rel-A system